MPNISIDDQTLALLVSQAASLGMTIEDFVRSLAQSKSALPSRGPMSAQQFDQLVEEASFEAPPLRLDFSRADIYDEHD